MKRSLDCDGIILHSSRSGEMHKLIRLLSPELGLVSATAFGARKSGSKLSGLAEPFVAGHLFLYYNPVRGQYKIEDIKAEVFHEGLRNDLSRLYAASFFAELIIQTYGGNEDAQEMYTLLLGLLSAIEQKQELVYIIIQGSWRFLRLLGLTPDLEYCVNCGRPLTDKKSRLHMSDHGLWCLQCMPSGDSRYLLGIAERKFLHHSTQLPLQRGLQVKLPAQTAASLKQAVIGYIDAITDGRLKTIRSGLL
ncbi:MAG: DNA repair protein RecO [Spirochaetota bacterium]